MNEIIVKFIAAAIINAQREVVSRYRQHVKGAMYIAFTTVDDKFLDVSERAVCQLGFDNEDFPADFLLDNTFALTPCDTN